MYKRQAEDLSLATLIGMTSAALKKPVLTQLAVLGGISIGGTINTIEELANVCLLYTSLILYPPVQQIA